MTLHVLGNAAVDLIYQVPHLPRPGETLLAKNEFSDLGGKGLNQAIMAARTGAPTAFWSAIGDDAPGAAITARLNDEAIDPRRVAVRPGPTDRSIIYVAPSGENTIVSTAAHAHAITPADTDALLGALAPGDLLLLQGNLTSTTTRHVANEATAAGARTLINPAPVEFNYDDIIPAAAVVIVNQIENRTLSGNADPTQGAETLVARGAGVVVTTRGAAGATLTTAAGTKTFAAPNVAAIDTTGAGDVFCGVFAGALALDTPPADAVTWAVAAAARAVTRHGTSAAFPTATEVAASRP